MATRYMFMHLDTVKLLSCVITQKLNCRINSLRNIILNGISFLMTKTLLYSDNLDDLAIEV